MEKNPDNIRSLPAWTAVLAIMSIIQIVVAFAMRTVVIIGPELTVAAGVAQQDVGILAGAASAGTMCFLLGGNIGISYWGSVRTLQIGALIVVAGALASIASSWWILIAAAFLIGLGYAPSLPACSEILARTSPPTRLALIMSIKQAGVPLGGAFAGLLLPAVTAIAGWQTAMTVTAVLAAAGAALMQPWRARLDVGYYASQPPTTTGKLFSGANLAVPFVVLKEIPSMLPLTCAIFCFASVQACIFAFFVTQLTTELGFSLVVAGAAFSAMQVSGTFSRIIMGGLADKLGSARALLLLAIASTAVTAVLSRMNPGWPAWQIMSIGAVIGLTSISWNGVYLAEVARIAPPGRISDATSGSTFFAFIAFSLAPFLFALGVSPAGGYGPCFAVMAGVQALAIPALLHIIRQGQNRSAHIRKHR